MPFPDKHKLTYHFEWDPNKYTNKSPLLPSLPMMINDGGMEGSFARNWSSDPLRKDFVNTRRKKWQKNKIKIWKEKFVWKN